MQTSAVATTSPAKRKKPAKSSVDGGKKSVANSAQYGNHTSARVVLKRGRARRSPGGASGHRRSRGGRHSRYRNAEATFAGMRDGTRTLPSTCGRRLCG